MVSEWFLEWSKTAWFQSGFGGVWLRVVLLGVDFGASWAMFRPILGHFGAPRRPAGLQFKLRRKESLRLGSNQRPKRGLLGHYLALCWNTDFFFLLERHLAQVAWSLSVLSLSQCTTSQLAPWTRGESNRG